MGEIFDEDAYSQSKVAWDSGIVVVFVVIGLELVYFYSVLKVCI